MRKNFNTETIEGRVYDHNLTLKTVQNQQSENYGKEFINGTLSVATDEEGLNVLTVHYTYVTPMTKGEKASPTFANLKKIMEGKNWVTDGKDAAMKVRLSTAAALNDFYPQGGDELVSQPRNEGGFVSILTELKPDNGQIRQEFKFDVVITGTTLVEADPEKNIDEDYVKINCAIFNFRNALLPFTLIARNSAAPGSVDYFLNLEASSSKPVYTMVKGKIVSTTVKVNKEIENAFGGPVVEVSTRQQKEWVVTWANPEPYELTDDSEETMTRAELAKAIADRNVYLEDLKAKTKEYFNNRGTVSKTAAPAPEMKVPEGGFNF